MADLIQPTEDEKKNGWTAETLTAYIRERNRNVEGYGILTQWLTDKKPQAKVMNAADFDPLSW